MNKIKTIEDLKEEVGKAREGREMVMTFTQEVLEKGKWVAVIFCLICNIVSLCITLLKV